MLNKIPEQIMAEAYELQVEQKVEGNQLVNNLAEDLEKVVAQMDALKKRDADLKKQLYEAMEQYGIKKWEMKGGTKITCVPAVEAHYEEEERFDEEALKEDDPTLYALYLKKEQVLKNGRKGYVRITLPK